MNPYHALICVCCSVLSCLVRLRAKADEEDSDAEDEELPPTAEEAAAQQQAMDKHAADCDKVRGCVWVA
jgi:hypothetical protein